MKLKSILMLLVGLLFVTTMEKAVISAPPQWYKVQDSKTYRLEHCYFINSAEGWAVGDWNTVLKTSDGGADWTAMSVLPSSNPIYSSVFFTDSNHGWIADAYGYVQRTVDGGNLWQIVDVDPSSSAGLTDLYFLNTLEGFVSGNYPNFSKTTDGGVSWTNAGLSGSAIFGIDFSRSNNNYGVLVGELNYGSGFKANAFYTLNKAISWEAVSFPTSEPSLRKVSMPSDSVAFAVGDKGHILKTTNGGANWSGGLVGSGSDFKDTFFISTLEGWTVGTAESYYTNDGGASQTGISLPGGQNTQLYGVYATDPNHAWIVGNGGTIYVYSDQTVTPTSSTTTTTVAIAQWYKIQDNQFYHLHRGYFINTLEGWAVGNSASNSYILKTTDGGISWTTKQILPLGNNMLLSVFFTDSNNGWVANGTGYIYKTNDGGNFWQIIDIDASYSNGINDIYFINSLEGFVAVNYPNLYKTTDGGLTWTNIAIPGSGLWGISFLKPDPNFGIAVGEAGSSSYRSRAAYTTNKGASWTGTNLLPVNNLLQKVSMPTASVAYAVGYGGAFTKTTDGGQSWYSKLMGGGGAFTDVSFISSLEGWIAGTAECFYTNDGGITQSLVALPGGQSQYMYGVSAIDPTHAWIFGNAGQIFAYSSETITPTTTTTTTTLGSVRWYKVRDNQNYRLNHVFFLNTMEGWAVGSNADFGYLLKTIDGGGTWTTEVFPTIFGNSQLNSVFFADSDHGWISGGNGRIYRYNSAIPTWEPISTGTTNGFSDLYFLNTLEGFAAGGNPNLIKTVDGGLSWTNAVIPGGQNTGIAFSRNDPNFAITIGEGSGPGYERASYTTDKGVTWTAVNTVPVPLFPLKVSMPSNSVAYSVGYRGSFLKTIDGGVSWYNKQAGGGGAMTDVFFVSTLEGWVVGTLESFYTNDGGTTLTPLAFPGGQGYGMFGVYATDLNHAWAVGDSGSIYVYTDQVLVTTTTTTTTTTIMPGPSTTTTTIKYPTGVLVTAEAAGNAIDVYWTPSIDPSGIAAYRIYRAKKSSAEVEVTDNFDSANFDAVKWSNKIEMGTSFTPVQSGGKLNISGPVFGGGKDNISIAGYFTGISYESQPRFIKLSADIDISKSTVNGTTDKSYLLAGPLITIASFDAFVFPWLGKGNDPIKGPLTLPGYLVGGDNVGPAPVGTTTVPDFANISILLAGDSFSLFRNNSYLGTFGIQKGSSLPHYYGFMVLASTPDATMSVDFDNFYAGEFPIEKMVSVDASATIYHDVDIITGETYYYAVSPKSNLYGEGGSNIVEVPYTTTTVSTTTTTNTTVLTAQISIDNQLFFGDAISVTSNSFAKASLFLNGKAISSRGVEAKLIDSTGIEQSIYNSSSRQESYTIPLPEIKAGDYILRIVFSHDYGTPITADAKIKRLEESVKILTVPSTPLRGAVLNIGFIAKAAIAYQINIFSVTTGVLVHSENYPAVVGVNNYQWKEAISADPGQYMIEIKDPNSQEPPVSRYFFIGKYSN